MAHSLDLLTPDDLARLQAKAERVRLERDGVLLRQGEVAGALFLIHRGFIRVERGGIAVARLGQGEVLGEMSFFEEVGASAMAVAEGDVEIDRVRGGDVRALLASYPELATR